MKIMMLRFLTGCFIAAMFLTFSSCANDPVVEVEGVSEEVQAQQALLEEVVESPYIIDKNNNVVLKTDCNGADIHWEYEGSEGPDHWDSLCEGWACGGMSQSPVNIIPPPTSKPSYILSFKWGSTSTRIVNNGHTIQFNVDDGSRIKLKGGTYKLLQFHFHAGSEHTVNGKQAKAEIHFVHQNMVTGKLAVVGVFIDTEEGKDASPFFDKFLEHMPHEEGDYVDAGEMFHPDMLMPDSYNGWDKARFWYYQGSLTTPPCSEIVNWIVMKDKVKITEEQMMELEGLLHENYRPSQPLFSRIVQSHGPLVPLVSTNW